MSECDEYTSQISHDILDKISRNTINKLNTRTSKSSSSMNTSITTKKKSNGMKVKGKRRRWNSKHTPINRQTQLHTNLNQGTLHYNTIKTYKKNNDTHIGMVI